MPTCALGGTRVCEDAGTQMAGGRSARAGPEPCSTYGRAGLSRWGWNEGGPALKEIALREALKDLPVCLLPRTTVQSQTSAPWL